MSFSSNMYVEYSIKSRGSLLHDKVESLLTDLYRLKNGSTERKSFIKQRLNLENESLSFVNNETISLLYKRVTESLGQRYRYETCKTISEYSLKVYLLKYCDVDVLTSYWIGNHCLDLYLPAFGMGIEVNGGIHFNEAKMKKDGLRDLNVMKNLKIHIMEIENMDVFFRKGAIFSSLKHNKKLSKKAQKTLARNIQIQTISKFCSIKYLSEYFGHDLRLIL